MNVRLFSWHLRLAGASESHPQLIKREAYDRSLRRGSPSPLFHAFMHFFSLGAYMQVKFAS